MKNDKIVNAFNTIQPNNEIKNRVLDKVIQKQHKKRPTFRAAVSFATVAAVICLIVFGSTFFLPQGDNIFVVKAYAMEVQEDGSVELREVDIADTRPEYWGGHIDGATNTMYVGLGLRCEGENIESVEFSTDNGFFAEQYIGNLADISTSGVPALYVGPDNQMVMFGENFDDVGSTITLDAESVDDYLLFWGTHYVCDSEYPSFPEEIIIHVKAAFSNGKTAEKDVTIDLSGTSSFSFTPSEEQKAQNQKDYEVHEKLLKSIPLDKCEVVPDSVQALTYGDTYEYHMGDPLATSYKPITEESMEAAPFDKNGILRISSSLPDDGSDGHIAVIELNGEGTYTGMVYKVPGELILEYMK
ncbi:MAG: hypothetical protein GXY49_13945 [Syntrophomonadaceae bacterium]|nr:hypothetical protein [Syntrophomonadaceae bacterium]